MSDFGGQKKKNVKKGDAKRAVAVSVSQDMEKIDLSALAMKAKGTAAEYLTAGDKLNYRQRRDEGLPAIPSFRPDDMYLENFPKKADAIKNTLPEREAIIALFVKKALDIFRAPSSTDKSLDKENETRSARATRREHELVRYQQRARRFDSCVIDDDTLFPRLVNAFDIDMNAPETYGGDEDQPDIISSANICLLEITQRANYELFGMVGTPAQKAANKLYDFIHEAQNMYEANVKRLKSGERANELLLLQHGYEELQALYAQMDPASDHAAAYARKMDRRRGHGPT